RLFLRTREPDDADRGRLVRPARWAWRRKVRDRERYDEHAIGPRMNADPRPSDGRLEARDFETRPIHQTQQRPLEAPAVRLLEIVVRQEDDPPAKRPDERPHDRQHARQELADENQVVVPMAPDP